MRLNGIKILFFWQWSIWKFLMYLYLKNDEMIPISTYGTCKLSSEALISAYSHMFEITGIVVRFANVVGHIKLME